VVVGVTNEPKSLVEKAVKKKRMKFPVAMVKTQEESAFGIRGFPSSYLLDVDGTILWKGHPAGFDREFTIKRLEKALERASAVPPVPEAHARSIDKHLAKGDFAKAHAAAAKSLQKEPENADLLAFVESIEGMVASRIESAEKAEENGEFGRAMDLYASVLTSFSGVPGAEDVQVAVDSLKSSKEAKGDMAAMKKWTSAMDTWRKGDFEKALKSVASIAKKYADTATGERAAEMLERHGG
jgi:hypothetical protein